MPKLKSRLLTRRTLLAHFEHTDPKLAQLIEIAGPYRLRANECASPFRHLAEAIVSQQISGAAARSILRRFVSACGLDPLDDTMFPTPAIVLSLDAPILRAAGLSAAKVIALQDLARKTIDGIVPDPDKEKDANKRGAIERALTYMGLEPGKALNDIFVDKVFIGSCTNSRIEDMREAAAVVKKLGQKVSKGVKLAMVVPGSGLVKEQAEREGLHEIFKAAGFDEDQSLNLVGEILKRPKDPSESM